MIVEFRLDEKLTKPAYLKSLYDIIEELNCTQITYLEECYSKERRKYCKTRVVEITGSDTMLSWLLLRMERYRYKISDFNEAEWMSINA